MDRVSNNYTTAVTVIAKHSHGQVTTTQQLSQW